MKRLVTLNMASWVLAVGLTTAAEAQCDPVWSEPPSLSIGPDVRYSSAMEYDRARGVLMLYGGLSGMGNRLEDTWTCDGAVWTLLSPGHSPGTRAAHVMAYDLASQRVLLFGGNNQSHILQNDLWAWDGIDWTLLDDGTGIAPSCRKDVASAFDSARQRFVVFGGSSVTGRSDETWEWDGSTWSNVSPVAGDHPSARTQSAMAFDALRGRCVLFGGLAFSGYDDETWEWNGTAWSRVIVTGPSPRFGHRMWADGKTGRVMLFSGSISGGAVSDLWEFDGAAWAEQIPSGAIPAARTAAAVAHDPVSGITTIFSGLVTPLQADTWTLTIGSGLTFGQQPQPASAFAGQTVTLHAEASGAPAIGYRWRRGGVALQDGLVASGGIITGAATDTLTISSCTMSDAGVYDVIATSACADAASVGASVIILPVCVADVDDGSRSGERDGAVGIEDLLYYLDLYDAGSLGADVDDGGETGVSDGGVGIEDLLFYLMRYDAGC